MGSAGRSVARAGLAAWMAESFHMVMLPDLFQGVTGVRTLVRTATPIKEKERGTRYGLVCPSRAPEKVDTIKQSAISGEAEIALSLQLGAPTS